MLTTTKAQLIASGRGQARRRTGGRRAPAHTERGSAALEALMLVVFLIIPLWMLLFNMGYAGMRLTDAQTATRLAAYEALKQQTAGKAVSGQQDDIANSVEGQVFPTESNVVDVDIVGSSVSSELGPDNNDMLGILSGVMGSLSGNTTVNASISRESPFQRFTDSDIKVALTTGGTPYTYCEMDNAAFNPFTATDDQPNVGLGILEIITESANVILAPFGGLPTGSDKC